MQPSVPAATQRTRLHRLLPWLAGIVFLVALVAVDRVLGRYDWRDVLEHLHATPGHALRNALLLTAGS